MFKSTIQRLALWFAFNVRVSKLFALQLSKFPSCSRQPAIVACWPLGKFGPIDWLVGPQKLFFTFLNQFNLGHASTQSCELPKRPILHIKSHKDWTVLHCTPTEEQNHRAEEKNAQTLLASIFDTLQFQPGSGCKCETMLYCSVSKLTSETTSSSKFIQ